MKLFPRTFLFVVAIISFSSLFSAQQVKTRGNADSQANSSSQIIVETFSETKNNIQQVNSPAPLHTQLSQSSQQTSVQEVTRAQDQSVGQYQALAQQQTQEHVTTSASLQERKIQSSTALQAPVVEHDYFPLRQESSSFDATDDHSAEDIFHLSKEIQFIEQQQQIEQKRFEDFKLSMARGVIPLQDACDMLCGQQKANVSTIHSIQNNFTQGLLFNLDLQFQKQSYQKKEQELRDGGAVIEDANNVGHWQNHFDYKNNELDLQRTAMVQKVIEAHLTSKEADFFNAPVNKELIKFYHADSPELLTHTKSTLQKKIEIEYQALNKLRQESVNLDWKVTSWLYWLYPIRKSHKSLKEDLETVISEKDFTTKKLEKDLSEKYVVEELLDVNSPYRPKIALVTKRTSESKTPYDSEPNSPTPSSPESDDADPQLSAPSLNIKGLAFLAALLSILANEAKEKLKILFAVQGNWHAYYHNILAYREELRVKKERLSKSLADITQSAEESEKQQEELLAVEMELAIAQKLLSEGRDKFVELPELDESLTQIFKNRTTIAAEKLEFLRRDIRWTYVQLERLVTEEENLKKNGGTHISQGDSDKKQKLVQEFHEKLRQELILENIAGLEGEYFTLPQALKIYERIEKLPIPHNRNEVLITKAFDKQYPQVTLDIENDVRAIHAAEHYRQWNQNKRNSLFEKEQNSLDSSKKKQQQTARENKQEFKKLGNPQKFNDVNRGNSHSLPRDFVSQPEVHQKQIQSILQKSELEPSSQISGYKGSLVLPDDFSVETQQEEYAIHAYLEHYGINFNNNAKPIDQQIAQSAERNVCETVGEVLPVVLNSLVKDKSTIERIPQGSPLEQQIVIALLDDLRFSRDANLTRGTCETLALQDTFNNLFQLKTSEIGAWVKAHVQPEVETKLYYDSLKSIPEKTLEADAVIGLVDTKNCGDCSRALNNELQEIKKDLNLLGHAVADEFGKECPNKQVVCNAAAEKFRLEGTRSSASTIQAQIIGKRKELANKTALAYTEICEKKEKRQEKFNRTINFAVKVAQIAAALTGNSTVTIGGNPPRRNNGSTINPHPTANNPLNPSYDYNQDAYYSSGQASHNSAYELHMQGQYSVANSNTTQNINSLFAGTATAWHSANQNTQNNTSQSSSINTPMLSQSTVDHHKEVIAQVEGITKGLEVHAPAMTQAPKITFQGLSQTPLAENSKKTQEDQQIKSNFSLHVDSHLTERRTKERILEDMILENSFNTSHNEKNRDLFLQMGAQLISIVTGHGPRGGGSQFKVAPEGALAISTQEAVIVTRSKIANVASKLGATLSNLLHLRGGNHKGFDESKRIETPSKGGPNGRYVCNSGKHHQNSKGKISKPPKDGQRALDNMIVKVSDKLGYSLEDGKLVEMRRQIKGNTPDQDVWHGYVIENPKHDLEDPEKAILKKAGLLPKKGI